MIGLKNTIYSTLFPHLRKTENPAILPNDFADGGAFGNEPEISGADTMDYQSANEMQNRINYDSTLPPSDSVNAPAAESVAAPFDPNNFSRQPNNPPTGGIAPLDLSGIDTSALEAAISKTPYQKAQENAAAVAAKPAEKQAAWKQALWMALQGANKFFNPNDQSEVTWLGEAKKRNQMIRANNELAPLQAIENQKTKTAQEAAKIAKAQADYRGVMLNNDGKVLDNASKLGKQAYETLTKKDFITPEEAKDYERRYGIAINPYDARTYKTEYQNGVPFSAPTKGAPDYRPNATLPVRKRDLEVPVTIGDSKGYSTSEKGLGMKINAEKDNLGRAVRVEENNQRAEEREQTRQYQSEKELSDDVQSWTQRQTQARAKLAAAEKKLLAYQADKAANAGYNTDAIDKQIAELAGDIEGAKVALQEPRPKGVVVPQNIKRKDAGKVIKIPKNDTLGLFAK